MAIINKAKSVAENIKLHWQTPATGRYMNYKEILSLAVGGIGIKWVISCVQIMILSSSSFMIGNVIGIDPKPMYMIYLLSVLAGFPLTALRAKIIDNTRGKKGKYRPYLMSMGIPTSILAIGFVWMPYGVMNQTWKCIVVLLFNIGFQFFFNFFFDAYDNYVVVLSPNTQERADVSAIRAVTDSFAPSLYSIIIPLFAKAITGSNTLTDIRIYKYAIPPMIIFGMCLGVLTYKNTREKIVQAKTHIVQMKFMDSLREVGKNKYFWIISLAGWLGFLESSYAVIFSWLYSYQAACNAGTYALVVTIYGNASLWGMLMAPFMIRRFGKRNVLIATNFLNIIFLLALWPTIMYINPTSVIWIVLLFLFLNGVVGAFAHILNPSLQGDIRDYQQYISGERIDGMFAAVGLIGGVITLGSGLVLPALYENGGINSNALQQNTPEIVRIMTERGLSIPKALNSYDVLYIPAIFKTVICILILASVVGAIMNVIPYFFYDLSELKQQAIIKVLKVRALFEDYGNNALQDAELVSAIDIVEHSREMAECEELITDKSIIKDAKKLADKKDRKAAVKVAKNKRKENKEFNDDIFISKYVLKELEKFNNPAGIRQYQLCKDVVAEGFDGIKGTDISLFKASLEKAKTMPTSTDEEKELRKFEIQLEKNRILSKKFMNKYYNGVELIAPDNEEFSKNINLYEEKQIAIRESYLKKSDAKKERNSEKVKQINTYIKDLKAESKALDKVINDFMEFECRFNRATKAYYVANKLLTQYENYQHFNDIADMYEESKARAEQAQLEKEAEIARLKAESEAQKEKLRAEKAIKKADKTSDKRADKKEDKKSVDKQKEKLKADKISDKRSDKKGDKKAVDKQKGKLKTDNTTKKADKKADKTSDKRADKKEDKNKKQK